VRSGPDRARFRLLLRGRFALWIGLVFLVGGVFAAGHGLRDTTREHAYRQHGEIVQATVTAKALRPATRDRGTSYDVSFRFIDTDGRPREGRLPVDAAVWEALGAGSPIAVEHVPGDPQSIRLAGHTGSADALVLLGLGLAFGALGGGLAFWHGRHLVRDWRVMRHGVSASGTVTGTAPTSIRINRQTQWVVNYRYTDAVGRQHDGRSPYMSVEAAQGWEPGASVDIRVHREHPELSVWMAGELSPAAGRQGSVATPAESSSLIRRLTARYGFMASLVLGGFILAVAAEDVPMLRDTVAFIDRHWRALFMLTAGATGLGFVLFMGGIVHMALTGGRPMSRRDVEGLSQRVRDSARPMLLQGSVWRIKGRASGRQGEVETSFGQIKAAWRQRAWRDDARWRYTFLIIGGACLMGFGLFASIGLLTESFVRYVLWLALAYAVVRTAWGLYQA
jgi:Protein of unknown function (DUF3592)